MNQREKVLAGCVAAVIVGYGGFKVIKAGVIEPAKRLQENIQKQTKRQVEIENRLAGAPSIVRGWQSATQRTLHTDFKTAHDIFREDIAVLLDRNRLTEGRSISKYKERLEKKGPREGFIDLPILVRVDGKLDDLVNFLRDLYQRPYMVRVDKLSVAAELESAKSKKKGESDEPKLKMTMTLSTLVVPEIKGVAHKTFDMEAFKDPEQQEDFYPLATPWLHQEEMSEYSEIVKVNPFMIYYEPPPLPRPDPPRVTAVKPEAEKPETNPVVKADPRKNADKFKVVGTASDGEPLAYVIDERDLAEPPAEYRLNDDMDGGKLVLIIPEGVVVHSVEKVGRGERVKDYYYEIGTTFADRVEVEPKEHAEIQKLLELVLNH